MRTMVAAVLLTLATRPVDAAEGKFKLGEASFKVAPDKSKIEASVAYDTDGDTLKGWRFGLKGTVPAQEISDGAQAELDEIPGTWLLGPTIAKELSWGRGVQGTNAILAFEPQWSFAKYSYVPVLSDLDTTQSEVRHSLVLNASAFYKWVRNALQLRVRYTREWKAMDEVGVVSPGSNGEPDSVAKSVVHEPPTTSPAFSSRLFYWHRFEKSQFGFGPSVAIQTKGNSGNSWSPAGKETVLRGEVWGYFMPAAAEPANLRIGLAPYIDGYLEGESDDKSEISWGLLLQVRIGAEIFTY